MNLINREKDNILSIAKSLRPLKDLYSRQNKDFDKYFRGLNLKDFVKQINTQKKYSFFLEPGEELDELTNKNMNENLLFKNPFNYYEELSNLKDIPFSITKKINKKKNRYNSEDNKNSASKRERSREILIKLKKSKNDDDNVTLDPGRYNPNYNFIKRRYPCAFLGRPKKKEDSFDKRISEQQQESSDKKETKNNTEEEIKNENNEKNKNDKSIKLKRNAGIKDGEKKNKKLFTTYSHRTLENKKSRDLKYRKINKMKFNISKNTIENKNTNKIEENEKIKSLSQRKLRRTTNLSLRLKSTTSSWSNLNFFDTDKKDKNKTFINSNLHQIKNKKLFKKNRNDFGRKASCENMRSTVIFDIMPGRERHMNFFQGKKRVYVIDYHPNYNFVRPHIPSTFFKSQRKYDEIKKYVTGKIIRSYNCNPGHYFVFDFNNFKESELNDNYRGL